MTVARQRLGRGPRSWSPAGLSAAGWRIVERNARTRTGELDLIALDGGTCLRRGQGGPRRGHRGPGARRSRSDPRKQLQLRRLAREWLGRGRARPRRRRLPLRRRRRQLRRRAARTPIRAHPQRLLRLQAASRRLLAELQLRVGDRGEGAPVKRRDAVLEDRLAVLGGRVADVAGEAPARVDAGRPGTCSGPCVTLAITEAAAIAALRASPSTTGGARARRLGQRGSRRRGRTASSARDRSQAIGERPEVGDVQTVAVDRAHRADRDRDACRRPEHAGIELLALLGGLLLRVVRARRARGARSRPDPLEVEQDPGGHQRARQRAAAGLVDAGDVAGPEGAVEAEELRGRWALLPPLGLALEDSDSAWRPVGGEGLADDPVSGDRSPEPAVVDSPTVVAHHEVMVGRNGDLFGQIALCSGLHGRMKSSSAFYAVDDGMAVLDRRACRRARRRSA